MGWRAFSHRFFHDIFRAPISSQLGRIGLRFRSVHLRGVPRQTKKYVAAEPPSAPSNLLCEIEVPDFCRNKFHSDNREMAFSRISDLENTADNVLADWAIFSCMSQLA